MRFLFLLMSILVPHVVAAEIIGVVDYEYKYNAAKGMNEPTFVICDCATPSLALAPKESPLSQPVQKNNPLLSVLAIKSSETPIHESTAIAKATKESMSGIETDDKNTPDRQFGVAIGTIYFGFDSSELTGDAISNIDKIVDSIKSLGLSDIVVNGYTCDIGTKKHNDKLAQKRVDVVVSYLKSKGVVVNTANGEGKCCYKSNIRKENRRVEIMGYMPKKNGGK